MSNNLNNPTNELAKVCELESVLRSARSDDLTENEYHPARRAILKFLADLGGIDSHGLSLPDLIDEASKFSNKTSIRTAALLVTRIAGNANLLPEHSSTNKLKLKVVHLFEVGLPDHAKRINLDRLPQTFEKFDRICQIHTEMCELLDYFRSVKKESCTVTSLLSGRQSALKGISSSNVSSYFGMYGQKHMQAKLNSILTQLERLFLSKDVTFANDLQLLKAEVETEIAWGLDNQTFLVELYYQPYVECIKAALAKFELDAKDRFACNIAPKRTGTDIAIKRYPLHEIGRIVSIGVILTNHGPGTACDIKAEVTSASSNLVFDPVVSSGDARAGDFLFGFDVLVESPASETKFDIALSWGINGQIERSCFKFSFKIVGQDANVDWSKLSGMQPYSTEVAEGADFVGRTSKVEHIAARYARDRMGSSFITGQKRVGKTSLAKAIASRTKTLVNDLKVLYLEYGQYSNMDAVVTLKNLGGELAEYMCKFHSEEGRYNTLSFQGSLSALAKLADELYESSPKLRFLFILDEFDEIDPALYRYGSLAEAFFSNLRTLSSKKNVAFLLVGGEKMPFVVSAQGDQLNKFVSERLDYFNRTSEWSNYCELVQKPVAPNLVWNDAALKYLFDVSNGHPYYTKLICASVFSNSVKERDTEITEGDVKNCVNHLVVDLDSNVFAHLWKDGISANDQQQAEVFELNRRRVLCSVARSLVSNQNLALENIVGNKAGLQISPGHINSTLMDFVRRGILTEKSGIYGIVIPLFTLWLKEVGISRLMADSLAEEYESKEQEIEERCRVTSTEIVSLTKKWNSYRGQQIGDEAVRAWLEQVPTNQERRLLFKILSNLRFVNHIEVREKLSSAHRTLGQFLPTFYQERKTDRRRDLIITWVDGPGKSGNTLAGLYAEENRISTTCIIAPESVAKHIDSNSSNPPAAIIVVDDFIGTGQSLAKNLVTFVESLQARLKQHDVKLLVITLLATVEGEKYVRDKISRFECEAELRIAEVISNRHFAFEKNSPIWISTDERGRAFELCQRLGSKIYKSNPLGYGAMGLLLVFQDTCPNNTLPIIHARVGGQDPWTPLFERPKN